MADRYIPEHRRTNFKAKSTFKPEELRRRREEQQVEIRKAKREESLAKRRGLATGADRPGASLGAAPDSDDDTAPTESQVRSCSFYFPVVVCLATSSFSGLLPRWCPWAANRPRHALLAILLALPGDSPPDPTPSQGPFSVSRFQTRTPGSDDPTILSWVDGLLFHRCLLFFSMRSRGNDANAPL